MLYTRFHNKPYSIIYKQKVHIDQKPHSKNTECKTQPSNLVINWLKNRTTYNLWIFILQRKGCKFYDYKSEAYTKLNKVMKLKVMGTFSQTGYKNQRSTSQHEKEWSEDTTIKNQRNISNNRFYLNTLVLPSFLLHALQRNSGNKR